MRTSPCRFRHEKGRDNGQPGHEAARARRRGNHGRHGDRRRRRRHRACRWRSGRGEFVLTETTTNRAGVDVDGSGTPTPGDAFIFHSVLTDAGGTRVGTVDGHCVALLGGRNLCHSVVALARGTLSTTFVAAAGSATLAISIDGGTGRFDRARGQIRATRASQAVFREEFDIDR